MFKQNYNVIGVMSGTSLDGIDLAYIKFNFLETWSFKIYECETVSYSQEWVNKLKNAIHLHPLQLDELNIEYTKLVASVISTFITKHQLSEIDAIASHGHTVLHQPHNGITLQIGNLQSMGDVLPYKIVCDFRVQDVVLGGQGAPLVPVGDALLFSDFDYCLNLGGFSNISFHEDGKRMAFDISPVNTVLNFYATELGFPYDEGGNFAKSGEVHHELLAQLNGLDFYKNAYPKSLGVEFVNQKIFPVMHAFPISTQDKLRTFVEHIALQIAHVCNQPNTRLLVTGGGAYNTFLMQRLRKYLPNTSVIVPDDQIIQFKEALLFGLLGVLKLRNEINVLSSVTGASKDHSSGVIFN